jgi:hypothetical protein
MDKVFDDPTYEFPGMVGVAIDLTAGRAVPLHPGQVSRCRLRVYREEPWKGIIAVATELPTNPGASITNAIEHLAGQVWRDFIPDKGHPPMLFDHYDSSSYGGKPAGDMFSLVTFHQVRADRLVVAGPDWQWWPGVMVRRLIADRTLGDGFERDLEVPGEGEDWSEVGGDLR